MNIRTKFVYPPVPIRDWDWQAYDYDSLDEGLVIGEGRTEWDAVCDLIENLQWKGRWVVKSNGTVSMYD